MTQEFLVYKQLRQAIFIVFLILGIVSCSNANRWIRYDDDGVTIPERTWQMLEDYNGDLWFAAFNGRVYHYDRSEKRWILKFFAKNLGLGSRLESLAVGFNNDIWVGTDSGLGRLSNGQWRLYGYEDGLLNDDVRAILQDSSGTLWVGTSGGLFVSEDDGYNWQAITIEEGFSNFVVHQIYEDSRSDIWIASGGALFHYIQGTSRWSTFTDGGTRFNSLTNSWSTSPMDQAVLVDDLVLSIFEDSNGFLWFGTFGGVNQYDPLEDKWRDFTTEDGLINNEVWAINEDQEGNLWFGTSDGLTRYNLKNNDWTSFNETNGFTNRSTSGIVVDEEGYLWVATFGKGVYRYDPNS